MKGITKDYYSIKKDYESLFTVWKINLKNFSHYISGYTFQFFSTGQESLAFMI